MQVFHLDYEISPEPTASQIDCLSRRPLRALLWGRTLQPPIPSADARLVESSSPASVSSIAVDPRTISLHYIHTGVVPWPI